MTTNIQFVKLPVSEPLKFYVTHKLQKLAEKFDWIINADVYYKLENDPTGTGKICEIELSMPGPRLFASSKALNYELATKNTISDLEKQLKKRKAVFMAN